jgi:GNAT superfamily N-acetyltransferase
MENIDQIGLYCSRSKHKEPGYQNKLRWIKDRFQECLEYYVLLVDEGRKNLAYRGMIEYMPAELCWRGIDAPGYMAIHCLWVIGRHKGKGYGSMLLQRCVNSAKSNGKFGVVGMTIKKGGWLPKKNIYLKNGFTETDELNDFQLYTLKFKEEYPDPMFHSLKTQEAAKYSNGFNILSSNQCPYIPGTIKSLENIAEVLGESVNIIEMKSYHEAQLGGLHPYGTFHIIKDGEYVSHLPGGMRDIKKALNFGS